MARPRPQPEIVGRAVSPGDAVTLVLQTPRVHWLLLKITRFSGSVARSTEEPMRTTQPTTGAFVALLLVVTTAPVIAHHSFAAEFDAKQPVTLRGTVTRMEWINPHSWIHIDVKNSDGTVTKWMIEAGTPNTLIRRGFTKQSLLPGT